MSKLAEQPARKLAAVIAPGERLLVAAQYEHAVEENWHQGEFARFAEALGLKPEEDIAHPKLEYGYLAVTDRRLVLANSPWFGSVKQKHIYHESPITGCGLCWYDATAAFNFAARMLLFHLPAGQYASVRVKTKWAGMVGKDTHAELLALADGIVRAFGERAVEVPRP